MKKLLALLLLFGIVGCATKTQLNVYSQPEGSKPIGEASDLLDAAELSAVHD